MSALTTFINSLLPFTDPHTPLWRDLIHTLLLGILAYIAYEPPPLLRQWLKTLHHSYEQPADTDTDTDNIAIGEEHEHHQEYPEPAHTDFQQPPPRPAPAPQANFNYAHPPNRPDAAPPDPAQPGPGPGPGPANARNPRAIGTKKARSLAQRDRRRAYHEFHRSQAAQRASEETATASEREAALLEEKRRRALIEVEVEERMRRERGERREREEEERRGEMGRRERTVAYVRGRVRGEGVVGWRDVVAEVGWRGKGKTEDEVDEEGRKWAGSKGKGKGKEVGEVVIMTAEGWIVRVDKELMQEVYRRAVEDAVAREEEAVAAAAESDGNGLSAEERAKAAKMTYDELADVLEEVVMERAEMAQMESGRG